jgi:hypothetical protein
MPSAIASTPSALGKKAGLLALLYFALAERNPALGETLFKRTQHEPPRWWFFSDTNRAIGPS